MPTSKQTVKNDLDSSVEGETLERVWVCILPEGTDLYTPDFRVVTLARPLRIQVPDDALQSVD